MGVGKFPSTLILCSVPSPGVEGSSRRIKTPSSQAQPWGIQDPPPLPSLTGQEDSTEAGPRPQGPGPPARQGSCGQPRPLPQASASFLPPSLPARHLVLVPSKRMRQQSLPLPVIKASPAQLTPKRPRRNRAASGSLCPATASLPLPSEAGQKHQAQRTHGLHSPGVPSLRPGEGGVQGR